MTHDQPADSDAENEPTSSPEQPPTSPRRRRGEAVMTIAVPEPVCRSCGGSALGGPLPEGDSAP